MSRSDKFSPHVAQGWNLANIARQAVSTSRYPGGLVVPAPPQAVRLTLRAPPDGPRTSPPWLLMQHDAILSTCGSSNIDMNPPFCMRNYSGAAKNSGGFHLITIRRHVEFPGKTPILDEEHYGRILHTCFLLNLQKRQTSCNAQNCVEHERSK